MNKKKKKMYEIIWDGSFVNHNVSLIVAKNEEQALKRFYKEYNCFIPSIISFKEYELQKEVKNND